MTTSVTASAHGQFIQALLAHPFGLVVTVGAAFFGLVGLAELATGRNLYRYFRPGPWLAYAVLSGLLLGWGVKVIAGLASGKYPLH